jgi:hypothetical protein
MLMGHAHVQPKINRHDIINDDCPKWLRAHMVRLCGLNIYDEPTFRIVRAERVYRRISIERPFFNDDQDPTQAIPMQAVADLLAAGVSERDALEEGAAISKHNTTPQKIEVGETWFPKYCFRGIVIERWQGAKFYGRRLEWEAKIVAEYPFLGAYPQFGDYEMIGAEEGMRWPSMDHVTEVIRAYRLIQETQPESPHQRYLIRAYNLEKQLNKKHAEVEQRFDNMITDEWTGKCGLLNRCSLAAGRYRQKLADQAHIKEHCGN